MILRIDSASSVPVYAQIVEQVKRAIASGILVKGDMLPSRRELAIELEINPLTVLKAYKELQSEGLIDIKQGLGCFVTASPNPALDDYRHRTLTDNVDRLIDDANAFGIALTDLEQMVVERIQSADQSSRATEDGKQCA